MARETLDRDRVPARPTSAALGALAIETRALSKRYPRTDRAAVDDLDLQVAGRELFGLLGPNGAGKTTTIGMLTTLVRPTGGAARVCGVDVTRDPVGVKRRIGVVSQHNTLDPDLTVAENLEFRARCFGVPARRARERAAELLETFGLAGCARTSPYQVSGGQAKRAMIARALAHRPDLLFLDEPTAGLDPQTRLHLWDVLRGLRADGRTVVLSTHYLQEAAELGSAALQALLAGLLVVPAVLLVHAPGHGPGVRVQSWPLLVVVTLCSALLSAATGLLLATLVGPQAMQALFAMVLIPMTMLGCVYYPWSALSPMRWLQLGVLANPAVYVSEGLRAALTPGVGHLSSGVTVAVLVSGTVLLCTAATWSFTRRVIR